MSQRPFSLFLPLLIVFSMGIGHAQPPLLAFNTNPAKCDQSNGKIVVVISNDNPPYQVSLYGGMPVVSLSSPLTGDSATFINLPGGNYTVVVTDAAGNSTTGYPALGDLKGPTLLSAISTTAASCMNNDGAFTVDLSGGTAPFSLAVGGNKVGRSTSETLIGLGVGSGPLAFTVTDTNGCVTPGTVTVPLNSNLSLSAPDATMCQGYSVTLAVVSNGTGFLWSPAAGLSSVSVAQPVASPTTTTTYTVTASLGVCSASATSTVKVLPAPVADAGGPYDTTCYEKPIQLQGSGGATYQWTPAFGLSDPTAADPVVLHPTANATYSLSVIGANGCADLDPSKVTVIVRSAYQVFAGNDTSVTLGQSAPLMATDVQGVGFSQYSWTPAIGLSNPSIADPVASFSEVGSYVFAVTAVGPNGCEAKDSVLVKVYALADIFVPNAFTPNHDGHNDVLRALPVSIKDFKYLQVFNRWGQQVFATTNASEGWDGTFHGTEAPVGTYVWIVGGVDLSGRVVEKRGTVILIR